MADSQAAEIVARIRAELEAAAKGLVLEATANLVEATPWKTGHARWNWVPSVGVPFEGESPGADQAAHDAGVAQVLAFKLDDGRLSISNNAPYINRLIAGSSSQAPAGWDVAAIDQAQQTIQTQYDGLTIDVSTGGTNATVTITPRGAP